MKKIPTTRKDIRVPDPLIKKVEQYQYENDISTWTGALLELVRKGLEADGIK
ncbi:hypothetical protein [Bacillus sp. 1P06AnD]|uniref:hypothetical protein n=1 Tax=Bacillus sp. 1P06AnD TaxID=3132208 RepID=UPI00399F27DE